jgi:hypothetical protein
VLERDGQECYNMNLVTFSLNCHLRKNYRKLCGTCRHSVEIFSGTENHVAVVLIPLYDSSLQFG